MRFRNLKIGKRRRRYGRKLRVNKTYQDYKYHCKVCDFICDSKTTARREVGTKKANLWAQGNIVPVADGNIYSSNVKKGCPQCGSPDSR